MKSHTEPAMNPWRRAAEWVMLSSVGWAVAAWATTTTLTVSRSLWPASAALMAAAISAIASTVALACLQWIAVRSITPALGRWLFASLMALILAAVASMPLKLLDWHIGASRLQWDELLYGLVFGALLGAGQGLALWGRSGRLGVWILCSAFGWAFATAIASALPLTSDVAANWVSPAVTGAIASLGTGLAWIICLGPAMNPHLRPVA